MKFTKGMKLTTAQKAQRAESRRRTKERQLLMEAEHHAFHARQDSMFGKAETQYLSISRGEEKALEWVSAKCGVKFSGGCDEFARLVLQCALARPKMVARLIMEYLCYPIAEGLNTESAMNHLLGRVVECSAYGFKHRRRLREGFPLLIRLEMRQIERDALVWLHPQIFPGSLIPGHRGPMCDWTVGFLLRLMLSRPETVVGMVQDFLNYKNAEGFDWRGEQELALARIAQCAEYDKIRARFRL